MFRHLKKVILLALPILLALLVGCQATPPASPSATPPVAPSAAPSPLPSPATPPSSPATTPASPPGRVTPDAVESSEVTFSSSSFNIKGYLSKPKAGGTFPALIIIHENRGLTDHIRDVARRYANQGFTVLAPDLLSRVGGTAQFATTDEAVSAIGKLSGEGVIEDLNSTFAYLESLPLVNKNRIGVLGYCWGGGNSLLFATRNSSLKAAVVYYGPNPANLDEVANIAAPMLGMYGADDARITVNVPALESAMKKYNKPFEYKVYPGAAHAFFNDTGTRYNAEAASDAWQQTVAFLQKQLKN